MMPETCWDKSLIINIRLVASCWFLSLHPMKVWGHPMTCLCRWRREEGDTVPDLSRELSAWRGGWLTQRSDRFTSGKTQYPLYGGEGQFGWTRKFSLPQGFNPQTARPYRVASTWHEQSQMINEPNDQSKVISISIQTNLKKLRRGLDWTSSG